MQCVTSFDLNTLRTLLSKFGDLETYGCRMLGELKVEVQTVVCYLQKSLGVTNCNIVGAVGQRVMARGHNNVQDSK